MTTLSERQQTQANALLLPTIRKLAATGLYAQEIAKTLGIHPRRVYGMVGQHHIAVKPKPKQRRNERVHRPEPAMVPAAEELWAKALAGRRYEDAAVVASVPRRIRAPMPTLTANSSMAWTA